MFIDTHLHLSKDDYDDISSVIERSEQSQVNKLIISGCDRKSIKEAIEIANKYSNVYLTLGYHPSEADITTNEDISVLKEILKSNNKVIGLGEIGLDYYWRKDNKEIQKELFIKQLKIAEELNLPVVIHSRDAYLDTYEILSMHNVKGVIHCFSGSYEVATSYIKLGFMLGIGGVITFSNSKLGETVEKIGLENIVLETDSPYLTPHPMRGKQNEPSNIPYIAKKISEVKNVSIENVADITTSNVYRLYPKIDCKNL